MKLTNKEIHLALADKNQKYFEFHVDEIFNRPVCTIISKVFLYDRQKNIVKKYAIDSFAKMNIKFHSCIIKIKP